MSLLGFLIIVLSPLYQMFASGKPWGMFELNEFLKICLTLIF